MALKIEGQTSADIVMDGVGIPTYDNLRDYLNALNSAGIFEGGAITDSGSGEIDIASAKGVIRTTDSDVGELVAFDIVAATNVALTSESMNYIYIDFNSGSPSWNVTTDYTAMNLQTQIIIGRVFKTGTGISSKLWIGQFGQRIQDTPLRDLYRLQTLRRFEHAYGDIISTPSGRYIALTAGDYFANYEEIATVAIDTSGAGRFDVWYRGAVPGTWTRVVDQAQIDNAYWDDGTGTLNTLDGVNHYGVHWVYRCIDGTVHVQYGQASYVTLADARLATIPTAPPMFIGLAILVGRVIIKNAATTITEVASSFVTSFTASSVTSHQDLANLQGGTTGEYYHASAADYAVRNLPIVTVSGTTQQAVIRTRYVLTNSALTTVTLPASASVGDFIEVYGWGSGGWKIAQNALQQITFLGASSTIGVTGYINSTHTYESVHLRYVSTNMWIVTEATGEIEVI